MKTFISALLVLSCAALIINCQELDDITPIANSYRSLSKSLFALAPLETCEGVAADKWICGDCHTLNQCDGSGKPKRVVSCADQYPGKPNCNTAVTNVWEKCVTNAVLCQENTEYLCPGKGLYPSLTNCKDYYRCTEAGAKSKDKFTCKYSSVFNYAKRDCITGAICYTVTLECGNKNKIIPYKLSTNLYVECEANKPAVLKMCPHKSLTFNPTKMDCEYTCLAEGTFANPIDPIDNVKSYYVCTLAKAGTYDVEKFICEGETKYDEDLKICTK